MNRVKQIIRMGMFLICLAGCDAGPEAIERVSLPRLAAVSQQSWQALADARIFFGHKSVGQDIIAGVEDLRSDLPVALTLQQGRLPVQGADGAMVLHAMVGENRDPESKINAFSAALAAGVGQWATIAGMKLCYADIDHATDVEALFARYRDACAQLQRQYPAVTFIHATVPLTTYRQGLKARVRRIVQRLTGAAIEGYHENIQRHRFNEFLRETFGPAGTLFDLALVESVSPSGMRQRMSWQGQPFFQLVGAYSRDRGHLNAVGRRHVAAQWVIFLADVAVRQTI